MVMLDFFVSCSTCCYGTLNQPQYTINCLLNLLVSPITVTSVHIMKKPNRMIIVGIVPLRFKHQEGKEIWVSPKGFQALNDVPGI